MKSLTLSHFSVAEVTRLCGQHTAEAGQIFTPEALALAFELTRGQPWLTNALAHQVVTVEAPDPAIPITAAQIERAKENLVQRHDTHLASLILFDSRPGPPPLPERATIGEREHEGRRIQVLRL